MRRYSELRRIDDFEDRYHYLALNGIVGDMTFGHNRYMNQMFYRSTQWKQVRNHVIARDRGCDLGIDGFQIHSGLYIHHMNPMTAEEIQHDEESILDPEYLITVSHRTHNAIHFGDASQLPRPYAPRYAGDTTLW